MAISTRYSGTACQMLVFLLVIHPKAAFLSTTHRHHRNAHPRSPTTFDRGSILFDTKLPSIDEYAAAAVPKWKHLYYNLMELCASTERSCFYYQDDYSIGDKNKFYRIFSYRFIPDYTEFERPGALECRGHMFEMVKSGKSEELVRMVCWPPEKFFNLNENPMTSNMDLSKIDLIEEKADGSLISSYLHTTSNSPELRLKTRQSLTSTQAVDSLKWLQSSQNKELHAEITKLALAGYTVNMEWVSPNNQIVLEYNQPALIVLGLRSNEDGSYLDPTDLNTASASYPSIAQAWVRRFPVNDGKTVASMVQSAVTQERMEGYVLRVSCAGDGEGQQQRVKVKTDWYRSLHNTRGFVFDSTKRLFLAAVEGKLDDLKNTNFPLVMTRIEAMEDVVRTELELLAKTVETFVQQNAHLERGDFARLAKEEFAETPYYFGIAMAAFSGGMASIDYEKFLKANYKVLNIKAKHEQRVVSG